ncbi:hypothetical protein D3C80_2149230 [compost metagenome]
MFKLHPAVEAKVQLQRQVRVRLVVHAGDLDPRLERLDRTPDIGADGNHQIGAARSRAIEVAQA